MAADSFNPIQVPFDSGQGVMRLVRDVDLDLHDTTGNNANVFFHGFCPKMSGDPATFLNGMGRFSVPPVGGPTGVTPGTYGDATHAPTFTVNAAGQLTAAAAVAISYPPIPPGAQFATTSTTANFLADPVTGGTFTRDTVLEWTGAADTLFQWAYPAVAPGVRLTIISASVNRMSFQPGFTGMPVGYRFSNLIINGNTVVGAAGYTTFAWDGSYWVQTGHHGGRARMLAATALTWSANVGTFTPTAGQAHALLVGNVLTVWIDITGTVSSSTCQYIYFGLPNGWSADPTYPLFGLGALVGLRQSLFYVGGPQLLLWCDGYEGSTYFPTGTGAVHIIGSMTIPLQ